jgi:hypothetical protein
MESLTKSLQENINALQTWCERNHMAIHPAKTKAMLITCWQKRQVIDVLPFKLSFNLQTIMVESTHKLLGVTIDHNLLWSEHIRTVGKIISKKLFQLAQIKNFLPQHAKKLFFHAYIMSLMNYCSTLWASCSNNARTPFDRLHKRAVKAILNKNQLTEKDYKQADILNLKDQLKYNKLLFMHKIVNQNAPLKLVSKFPKKISKHPMKIDPGRKPNTDLYKTSLSYSGPVLWNSLPEKNRLMTKISTLKKNLKKNFLQNY